MKALAYLAGILSALPIGWALGLSMAGESLRETEALHVARDAEMRVACAMANEAWQGWRDLSTLEAVARWGPTGLINTGATE